MTKIRTKTFAYRQEALKLISEFEKFQDTFLGDLKTDITDIFINNPDFLEGIKNNQEIKDEDIIKLLSDNKEKLEKLQQYNNAVMDCVEIFFSDVETRKKLYEIWFEEHETNLEPETDEEYITMMREVIQTWNFFYSKHRKLTKDLQQFPKRSEDLKPQTN